MMRRALRQELHALFLSSSFRSYTDAKTIRTPTQFDQLLDAQNEAYVNGLLQQYKRDPTLVAQSWIPVLENLENAPLEMPLVSSFHRPNPALTLTERERIKNMSLSWMIRSFERKGHYVANVNPLQGVEGGPSYPIDPSSLDPSSFGFTEADLEEVFYVALSRNLEATFVSSDRGHRLKSIVEHLRRMYCGSIGFEFIPTGTLDVEDWFRQESLNTLIPLERHDRLNIFEDVVHSCGFEQFLHLKYGTQQRFGIDGAEALIPAMRAMIQTAYNNGVRSCTLGMAHRGRLNVLSNVLQKPLTAIFCEFEGKVPKDKAPSIGDVKYHLGLRKRVKLRNGGFMDLDLLPNPSHLEAVNPLVIGKARARQFYEKDTDYTAVLPILIHGDASIMGQGCCYETVGLSSLENYNVGGTIHIIVNNQIGFTAIPEQSRSSIYCSDLSKVTNTPVLHVNGDNVEACVRAGRIAALFRQSFHRDIIIDLVCYRRNGHNEADFPDFTQPQLYKYIRKHPILVDIYAKQLVSEGVLTEDTVKFKKNEYNSQLRQAMDSAQSSQDFVTILPHFRLASENQAEMLELQEDEEEDLPMAVETGVEMDTLHKVGIHITTVPAAVRRTHPVLHRTYASRKKAIESGDGVEWCLGELLAFGTLALEGVGVRLSGEDVERGTFTQRHAVVTDQQTNLKYTPVATISEKQAPVTICNSSLSELGVCGFECGYNIEDPSNLCMWEAQFGDFANGAQVIIDQFISCGEEKWDMKSSIVLSLPHGYSGAGAEHSSARIERYLQLCSDTDVVPANFRQASPARMMEARIQKYNWQVCYPSTPANYFHMLRRQVVREGVKPLVFFFSKARLRPPNVSSLKEMEKGTSFLPVIDTAERSDVVPRKVLFCSGQIESIVHDRRQKLREATPGVHEDVVLVKVEQLSPFPWEQVADVLEKYHRRNPNVEFAWLQEEPKNMGAWAYVRLRFQSLMRHLGLTTPESFLKYIGRPAAAAPSTGYGAVHVEEEKELVAQALA
ncbi:oxoglutarate dehydrogenase (succinyl-transferring) [Trypanosoma rangeli]|uniref:Oxoglutarate dehydrogenase (Succinyl-transferring) n=1 Tax=Trypanosoma rangeli TaxID=5698 RepID=A0A3S5IR73_TRYRA|nr:oxoglutarate dehydrogenase (succinyl-transferring) [Trypanosoma rangeli]RNF04887.1 oxoglutarate dehydrogenase (succinyl-transferring) [Trypanosoma rangeli]|eukprot:RNF04887.1 oxoglutarate dehydrogenase (succinyl-transferring) [Trypanosoma rangeli]